MVRGPVTATSQRSTAPRMSQHGVRQQQTGGIDPPPYLRGGWAQGFPAGKVDSRTCGEGPQQSPRTVKRLTEVSNKLQKMAVVNNGHLALRRQGGHGKQRPAGNNTAVHGWTQPQEQSIVEGTVENTNRANPDDMEVYSTYGDDEVSENQTAPRGILHVHDHDDQSEDDHTPQRRPKKHVRISELRRASMTGSLPDLTKASEEDVQQSDELAAMAARRTPLPEGSEAFQAAMRNMDGEDPEDIDQGRKSGRRLTFSLKNLRMKAANSDKLINRFRSKTAEVICVNRFVISYPKYMDRLVVDGPCSGSAPHSPVASKTFQYPHREEISVTNVSDLMNKAKSMPSTPRIDLSPSSSDKGSFSPALSLKPFPHVGSTTSEHHSTHQSPLVRSSTNLSLPNSPESLKRFAKKRAAYKVNSVGSPAPSPRLLSRKQTTKDHTLLSKTHSSDV